jgi:CBS domain-containing protein
VPVRQITLFIFGGVSEMAQAQASSPKAEFQTTIAGPLASMGLGILFLTMSALAKGAVDRIVMEMLRYLCYVNFLLAGFNLIPGFPLDGGRVLRSYLWYRSGNLRQATRSAARVGQILAISLMGLGLLASLLMHVLPGIWLILIGLFLRRSAQTEYESFEVRLGLRDLTVRQTMTPPVAVDISMTISEFVNEYVFHYHHRAFPVLDQNRFVGMVDVRSIRRIPTAEWSSTKIAACLSDPGTYCVLDPDVDAAEAFRILTTRGCSRAPIVRDASLLGILTRSDLLKLISLRQEIAA